MRARDDRLARRSLWHGRLALDKQDGRRVPARNDSAASLLKAKERHLLRMGLRAQPVISMSHLCLTDVCLLRNAFQMEVSLDDKPWPASHLEAPRRLVGHGRRGQADDQN